jgi:hypothetical protein
MSWIADNPESYAGQRVGSGHCVGYVQEACGAPHTSRWRQGRKVRGGDVAPGTAIATFDPSGRYGNHVDGRSHAAIFIEELPGGLHVWDQWLRHPVSKRVIRFKGSEGRPVNNGDAFAVIEEATT